MSLTDDLLALLAPHLDRPLVVVDVGARWGCGEGWAALQDKIMVYGVEPDAEECARLQRIAPSGVRYVPAAFSDSNGRRTLHITQEPACSSLIAPDPVLSRSFAELECMAEIGSSEIEVERLDDWAGREGVDQIDAIKVDVQGEELNVLRGSGDHLDGVVALDVEVEFNPLYEGQPLFGDVDRYLRGRGFSLWRLRQLVHYSPAELPGPALPVSDTQIYDSRPGAASHGGGQLYWSMATYVRTEHTFGSVEPVSADAAIRAAAAALGFGAIDFALTVLHRAAAGPDGPTVAPVLEALRRASGLEAPAS